MGAALSGPASSVLWQASAARPVLDGVAADEPFSVTTEGRLAVVTGASVALRALLFGAAACGVAAAAQAQLTGAWKLAGLAVADRSFATHFGLATAVSPLPPGVRVVDYLSWMMELRGHARRHACTLADAALVGWSLARRARQKIERLSLVETQALRLAAACADKPAGLIVDRPYLGLDADHAALLDERLQLVTSDSDVILLCDGPSAAGPYAGWLRRASDVLVFRGGQLRYHRSGLSYLQSANTIEMEVLGSSERLCAALGEAGIAQQSAGSGLLVTLGEGQDMQLLIELAAASETALIRCTPVLGG